MRLLAGSLNVEVDQFLHAGYLSAYPRSFETSLYDLARAKVKVIDVAGALELKSAGPQAEGSRQPAEAEVAVPAPSLPPASIAGDAFTAAVLFFFFALLVGLYYRRARKVEQLGWRPRLLAVGPLLLFLVGGFFAYPKYQEYDLNSLPPPWQGVPVQEYRSPEAATEAILHGLIVPALAGCPVEVKTLSAIQREVAFPVPPAEHTAGMAYAVKTYGRDGWGREFRFESLPSDRCVIASAGPDGVHGTADDVDLVVPLWASLWERLVNGIYVRQMEGQDTLFIHRVEDPNFLQQHPNYARTLTGTDLFDVFEYNELIQVQRWQERIHPITVELEKHRGSHQGEDRIESLLFVQVLREDNG